MNLTRRSFLIGFAWFSANVVFAPLLIGRWGDSASTYGATQFAIPSSVYGDPNAHYGANTYATLPAGKYGSGIYGKVIWS